MIHRSLVSDRAGGQPSFLILASNHIPVLPSLSLLSLLLFPTIFFPNLPVDVDPMLTMRTSPYTILQLLVLIIVAMLLWQITNLGKFLNASLLLVALALHAEQAPQQKVVDFQLGVDIRQPTNL